MSLVNIFGHMFLINIFGCMSLVNMFECTYYINMFECMYLSEMYRFDISHTYVWIYVFRKYYLDILPRCMFGYVSHKYV